MTHVSIGSPASHQVVVESDESLTRVINAAMKLWHETTVEPDGDDKEPPSPGPGYGFHTELRQQPDMHPNDLDGNTPL